MVLSQPLRIKQRSILSTSRIRKEGRIEKLVGKENSIRRQLGDGLEPDLAISKLCYFLSASMLANMLFR